MNNTNNFSARMSYDQAKKTLYDSWIKNFIDANPGAPQKAAKDCRDWVESRKLSQGEYRFEVNLQNGNSIFTFGVTTLDINSSNVVFPTEIRIKPQDSLIMNEHAILIAQTTGNADTAFPLRSYPNTQDFAAADVTALNNSYYSNGGLTMKVNNDVIIPYRGLNNFLYRGQTQQTAALGAASPQDQFRGAEDGYITDEPNILLIGSKSYVPQIVLAGPIALTNANIRAVFIARGIVAQNSTVIN